MDTKSAAILKLETQYLFTAYTLIPGTTQYSNASRSERHVWSDHLLANKVCER